MGLENDKHNILITGRPGVGKTTLIVKLAEALHRFHPVGFYTAEIREQNVRKGFELISLCGRRRILSHVEIQSPYRVGKYGVDVSGFERFLDEIKLVRSAAPVIIIDEIGKMECLSDSFIELIIELLDSPSPVIATIARIGGGIIERIKQRDDVRIIEITPANRNRMAEIIHKLLEF